MKITVHTLTHTEAGIVAQVVEVEGGQTDISAKLSAIAGVDFESDDDYSVDVQTHEV